MILITGASGNAGGAVLKEVLKANRPVKATYRSPEDGRGLLGTGIIEPDEVRTTGPNAPSSNTKNIGSKPKFFST